MAPEKAQPRLRTRRGRVNPRITLPPLHRLLPRPPPSAAQRSSGTRCFAREPPAGSETKAEHVEGWNLPVGLSISATPPPALAPDAALTALGFRCSGTPGRAFRLFVFAEAPLPDLRNPHGRGKPEAAGGDPGGGGAAVPVGRQQQQRSPGSGVAGPPVHPSSQELLIQHHGDCPQPGRRASSSLQTPAMMLYEELLAARVRRGTSYSAARASLLLLPTDGNHYSHPPGFPPAAPGFPRSWGFRKSGRGACASSKRRKARPSAPEQRKPSAVSAASRGGFRQAPGRRCRRNGEPNGQFPALRGGPALVSEPAGDCARRRGFRRPLGRRRRRPRQKPMQRRQG